ncbi:hypothetical protein COLO4_28252 [Corchorus olitorius]|uniref:Uncharacterized protein n=1 Tax=Corchorus olitorius TaxID=93759 RepID=A0A1R3HLX5_9ROSI|nr:hypothetical protein COLO4_28252 [Corchorus olitorius]
MTTEREQRDEEGKDSGSPPARSHYPTIDVAAIGSLLDFERESNGERRTGKDKEEEKPSHSTVEADYTIVFLLQHKAPLIEELEQHMHRLDQERASVILERRSANNDDEMVEVEEAVKAAMLVFKERGKNAAAIEYAAREAQAAPARGQANLPVKLDEFG